jgi:RNA polymerase sigma-70 factor (ECF subfamily)
VQIFTDAQLLALIARGENWALSEIYDRYAGLVFSIALRILSDSACADEIVQGVFTKAGSMPGIIEWNAASFHRG